MKKDNTYKSPSCAEFELYLEAAILEGSLQDLQVDPFDWNGVQQSTFEVTL